ncbi:MAG: DUF4884 domain-containing protein [Lewinellaceae bacterium]|nr:DUF4884 domain-containing protein [Lewinellaceae bacterium]
MLKLNIFLIVCALFTGCYSSKPLVTETPKNNSTYAVEYLFEHEGCKVYRFNDRGNAVYFTNCRGETIAATDSTQVRNTTNTRKNR